MSIFRDTDHPLGVSKVKSPVEGALSKIRRFPDPDNAIEFQVTGRVKWFSRHKGYGFIDIDRDYEIFVHYSSIKGNGYRILNEGDKVIFDIVKGDRGYQATNVKTYVT